MIKKSVWVFAAMFGVALGSACPLEPPDFWGRYWCFDAEGATGHPVGSDMYVTSIHRNGNPVRTCFCFCDQLHADTLLFTGENPPEPSEDWLQSMALERSVAVQKCRDTAIDLGLLDDNCDEVTPEFPTWRHHDHECAGGFENAIPYCTDPDNADGETGAGDTGGLGEPERRAPR